MAFNCDPEFQIQDRAVAAGPAHTVQRDGMDGDWSVGWGNTGNGGAVVEPDALGSDGVRKHPEKVGQRRTHIAHGRTQNSKGDH
jgi:hypothetical protein